MNLAASLLLPIRLAKKNFKACVLAALISIVPLILWAYASNPPVGRTGAPGESTCAACHGGRAGTGNVTIKFSGGTTYTPGVTQQLTVTVNDPSATTHGFEMTAVQANATSTGAGSFTAGDANSDVQTSTSTTKQYPSQTNNGVSTFLVNWTPPATNIGNVGFYIASVAGTGSGTSNSSVYTASYTLTPASGGTTAPNLTLSPSALTFNYQIGGTTPAAQTVTTASSGAAQSYTVTKSATWLSVTPTSGTTPTGLSVSVNPSGLAAGTYTGTVSVAATGAANSPQTVGVTFNVTSTPPSSSPSLTLSPATLTFNYQTGGSTPAAQTVTTASSGAALSYTATKSATWLSLAPSSGNTPTALSVSVNPSGLATGTYTGTVSVAATGAANAPQTVGVTLNVSASTSSGNGTITGTLRDIVTGSAIGGAKVADNTGRLSYTSSSGAYTLDEPAGSYTLTASASGYLSTTQVATVTGGATSTNNWSLTKSYGTQTPPASKMNYVILAWNDLGMHCDQNDYSHFAVLPPYNTLHAQIIRRGGEGASLVTSGIVVSYYFPKKTNSTLHTNFWTYAPQYGWNVPPNVGITGTKLAGNMTLDPKGLSYQAVGIPITPYDDDGTWDPYGDAVITVKDSNGNLLQRSNVVAPVSTEMMCSNCHGTASLDPTLDTQTSILNQHDMMSGTSLLGDYKAGKVHLCASCHSSNALGAAGVAGVESLSLAMHNQHKDKMNFTAAAGATTPGCYNCHPGTKTQCLRGIMARAGKSCVDCHGDMTAMATSMQNGRQPWLQEPKCGQCHASGYGENSNTLYRNSTLQNAPESGMNGKIYCEACHNSTHGESISANPADAVISHQFQGDSYWIWNCNVCHSGYGSHKMHQTSTSGTGYHDE